MWLCRRVILLYGVSVVGRRLLAAYCREMNADLIILKYDVEQFRPGVALGAWFRYRRKLVCRASI